MKSYLKIFAWTIFLTLISLCTFLLIISYPQAYYFNDSLTYKNFHVHYDKKIPNQAYAILDSLDQSIRQSELYDPTLQFKIFLRSDINKYNFLPFQFPDDCIGWAIPVIQNVFLHKSDITTNTSYNPWGHTRALSSVLAHELTHIMVDNKFPLKSKMAWFDSKSLTEFGALWKEEGYAEYIAGGATITLDEGLKILNGETVAGHIPHLEYFKYWLSVRHLILRKHMTFEEILNKELNLNEVLEEAKRAEYKDKGKAVTFLCPQILEYYT